MISLGCPRNLVDSEVMVGILKEKGYPIAEKIDESDIAIVNTCAFIKDATDESIDTILALADLKKRKIIKHIIVAGCLAQRYKDKLKQELAEVDGIIGTGDLPRIGSIVRNISKKKTFSVISEKPEFIYSHRHKRSFITPTHYIYVKIQEGCSNKCSYCIIPQLRGQLRSRPRASILKEIEAITEKGIISELNIIGQDTTFYGYDLYKESRIADLLRSIATMDKVRWIRLLYTHPAHYSDELIEIIKNEASICKYLDLPIQHISDKVLKDMNRNTTAHSIQSLIERLRENIPGLAIRTTVMVGFPGETESDFKKLLSFLKDTKFERLGVFSYSNEEGSRSARRKDQISDKVKQERLSEIMKLQQEISSEQNSALLGRALDVLIDEKSSKEEGLYLGRTESDAPSVDGQVFVKAKDLKPGDFVKVNITDTLEYDLVGEVA